MSASTPTATSPRVLTDLLPGERVRDVLLTVGFTLALALGAQIKFFLPGTPVPISAQTLIALAGAIALGSRRAAAGGALFLGAGLAGVPWFTTTSGATVGYVVGFVVAGALLGAVAERGHLRTVPQVAGAMVVGNAVIYAFGATWLGIVTGSDAAAAVTTGVLPFLIGDAIKIAAAVAILPALWAAVGRDR